MTPKNTHEISTDPVDPIYLKNMSFGIPDETKSKDDDEATFAK